MALTLPAVVVLSSIGAVLAGAGHRSIVEVIALVELGVLVTGVRFLFTGKLITRREADEKDARLAAKEAECQDLRSTLSGMTDAMETTNAMMSAIMAEAQHHDAHPGTRRASSPPPRRRAPTREGPPA